MKVDGACHCGNIAYETDVDPEYVGICHCTDCQTMSGSAFRVSVQVPLQTINFTAGSTRVYVKTTDRGTPREQHFCENCGTHVYAANPGGGDQLVSLRVSTIRQRDELPPRRQIWCRSAQNWVNGLGDLPAHEQMPT